MLITLLLCTTLVHASLPCPAGLPVAITSVTVSHPFPRQHRVAILGTLADQHGGACVQGPLALRINVAYAGVPVHTTSGNACLATTCPLCPGSIKARHRLKNSLVLSPCCYPQQVGLPFTLPAWAPAGPYTLIVAVEDSTRNKLLCSAIDLRGIALQHGVDA